MANSSSNTIYVVSKDVDQSVANNTVLVNDNELKDLVYINKSYWFKCSIIFNLAGAISGFKFAITAPVGATAIFSAEVMNTTTNVLASVDVHPISGLINGSLVNTGDHIVRLEGFLKIGINGGQFGLQFAQNTSDAAAITVKEGSTLIYAELN